MILVIKYKTFIFKRPSPLDNSEYNTLKWLFDQNPKQKIKNIGILLGVYEESFKDLFYDMRFSIYLLIVILGSILISLLLQLFGLIDISIDKTEISLALGFLLLFTNQIALFFL